MTAEQVSLVRATWRGVQPIADAAAALFYERLVTLEPGLRPLVARTDMAKQRQKLLQALGSVVASADRLHVLTGTLEELGRRHAAA
jgi:hemoglobin-like flavoprotein